MLAGPRGWAAPFAAMDMAETGDAYSLSIELPGLGAEDMVVRVRDGALIVSGKKSYELEED